MGRVIPKLPRSALEVTADRGADRIDRTASPGRRRPSPTTVMSCRRGHHAERAGSSSRADRRWLQTASRRHREGPGRVLPTDHLIVSARRSLVEHGVGSGQYLVEVDVGGEGPEPERQAVRDEMHLIATPRQRQAELGGDHAAAAEMRVAGDSDPPQPRRALRGRGHLGTGATPRLGLHDALPSRPRASRTAIGPRARYPSPNRVPIDAPNTRARDSTSPRNPGWVR